ncbi:PTI1-like tyrosine-protein kinase 3 [Panicum virgatum]|uniref:PTI1-like tyrosine-protein kinase 3 n=1 Tax=Panicum virgatum TaxID=38727 RepID=UPI0019D56712|nr:PTI1-like tyrosine-protein kinase 3 [Panicum virgatum]
MIRGSCPSGNRRREVAIAAGVPELTPRELKEATAKFSASRLIGRGEHAEVFRATLRGGRAAAAKRLIRAPPAAAGILREQVAAASKLRHENVVRLLGYSITAGLPVLLYELADVGTLHDVLHGTRPPLAGPRGAPAPASTSIRRPPPATATLGWEQRVRIALDAAAGLAYLHAAAVTHRGVRSTSVLLFQGFRAKIAEHDVFKQKQQLADQDLTQTVIRYVPDTEVGYYHPMELMCSGRKMDVFSFGVVLLELLTGRKPHDNTLPGTRVQQFLMFWARPLLAQGRVEECIDPKLGDQYPPAGALKLGRIALQCLQDHPASRPSMDTVVRLINRDVVVRDQRGARV